MTVVATGWHCSQCGMCTRGPVDYHPYAACLMFMGCKDGNTVQANLDAVVKYGRDLEAKEHAKAEAIAQSETRDEHG
jgi:hypothetical protein